MKFKVECYNKYPVKMSQSKNMSLIISGDEIIVINIKK